MVFADTETHESLVRVVNALEAVKEFKNAGNDVQLIFDRAGVKWAVDLVKLDHKLHDLYEAAKDRVSDVCDFCAVRCA